MSILINSETKVLIQGITGRSGLQVAVELLDYGTKVQGGITPEKGGQTVHNIPVFNSVKEALSNVGAIDVSMVYAPPLMVYDAALEAINAKIPLIHIFAEHVPILDACRIVSAAKKAHVRILGPASVGAISPGEAKIGSIGGPNPNNVFSKGPIGVISKSGGMCSELAMLISNAGFGQSTVVGIGGDLIAGTTFADLLLEFQKDEKTRAVAAFGEVGGNAEIEAAQLIKERKFTKPFIIFIAGKFAEKLPQQTALGHAGAIVGVGKTMEEKIKILRLAGAYVAEHFEDIPALIKKVI